MNEPINNADRGFTILSESWYADANRHTGRVDQIMFGLYPDDGTQGTCGEMAMTWTELGKDIVPRLEVYDDAWRVFASFNDVIHELAKVDGQNITPTQFAEILKSCGFRDFTKREKE